MQLIICDRNAHKIQGRPSNQPSFTKECSQRIWKPVYPKRRACSCVLEWYAPRPPIHLNVQQIRLVCAAVRLRCEGPEPPIALASYLCPCLVSVCAHVLLVTVYTVHTRREVFT